MRGGLSALAGGVILTWGWRRFSIAFAAGAASALALPPIGAFPVLALTFPLLVWLLDGAVAAGIGLWRTLRAAFAAGWWFGFGFFLAGLWWIGAAFLVDADMFAWLLPIGVAGLPAGLALFTGLGAAIATAFWSGSPWRIGALAFGLGLAEYLRGTVLTGFPWNTFGYALTITDAQMQAASLVGVPGLTVLALFCFAAPAVLADPPNTAGRGRFFVPALALLLLVTQAGYGAWRLSNADQASVADARIRLVQPNLTQAERRDASRHADILERYVRLSIAPAQAGAAQPTVVIWPESALPFGIEGAAGVMSRIRAVARPGTALIAGLQRPEENGPGAFNSLYVFDEAAQIIGRYDKVHLVPFGEYLPFPEILAALGLEPLTRVLAFVPGTRRASMTTPGAPPFGPLICYEAIFPGAVLPEGERPRWLVNVSDDSWFDSVFGPRQHFHHARLRAAEEGLPLVRVTTTGISGVIDSYGRILAQAPPKVEIIIDSNLPVAQPVTFYGLYGDKLLWAILLTTLLVAMTARFGLGRVHRKRKGTRYLWW